MRAARYTGTLTAAALAALYLIWDPVSPDLAAQAYRAATASRYGFAVYDPLWYGGHHLPAYSLLSPPLFALMGPQLVAAIAAVAATFAFERLVHRHRPPATAVLAAVVFAVSFVTTSLVSGRLTFALGAALATVAVAGRTTVRALPAAAAAGLASPVAGGFLAVAFLVWAAAGGGRSRLALAAAALVPAATLTLLFGDGGDFPYAISSLLPTLAVLTLLALALPPEQPTLRLGAWTMVLLVLAAGLVDSPMGGNANRPGTLLAGTIAVLGLWPRHRLRLALIAPVLLVWQIWPTVADVLRVRDDPATKAEYYAPLRAELERRSDGLPVRIEVPFTSGHWEARWLTAGPGGIALARGWERQLDREVNPLFYDGTALTAVRYHRWLTGNAVAYVALPGTTLDYSARAEADLIRRGVPGLDEIWSNADWRLFAVRGARPLADGAVVTGAAPDLITFDVRRPGPVLLRFAFSPYMVADAGIGPVPGSRWIRVCVRRTGPVAIRARVSWDGVRHRMSGPRSVSCR